MAALTKHAARPELLGLRVGIAAAIVVGAAGCVGLFRPATPEAPSADGTVDVPLDYEEPESTLETIARAVAAKGRGNGQQAYVAAFADSTVDGFPFYAEFDPEVVARRFAGRPVPTWNLALERNFYGEFVLLFRDNYLMRWTDLGGDERNDATGDAKLFRRYEVFVVSQDGGLTRLIAVGRVDLAFKRITGERWAITRWWDRVDPAANPNEPDQITLGERRLNTQ